MPAQRARLTLRVPFSAAHRYYRPEWDEARNRESFGDNLDPHGHNYVIEATVEGEVDERTGMAADLGMLKDRLRELASELGYQELTIETPVLEGRVPTTENLALLVWRRLRGKTGAARLVRVRVYESPELFAEVEAPERERDGERP